MPFWKAVGIVFSVILKQGQSPDCVSNRKTHRLKDSRLGGGSRFLAFVDLQDVLAYY